MPDPTGGETDSDPDAPADASRIPDESTLLGATGVEQEVLAEAARAEGELADPTRDQDDVEDGGAQV